MHFKALIRSSSPERDGCDILFEYDVIKAFENLLGLVVKRILYAVRSVETER